MTQTAEFHIDYRPVETLIPYMRNARLHSADQIAQLMGSIMEWGWTNPVLADANGIVAGHGRVKAAMQLYDQGKEIKLPSGQMIPRGSVPVLDCTGWSEVQRQAYVIADNKLALNAEWDYDILRLEVDALREAGMDLELVGFSDDEINVISAGWESDIELTEGLDPTDAILRVQVKKEIAEAARGAIEGALEEAGIEYKLPR